MSELNLLLRRKKREETPKERVESTVQVQEGKVKSPASPESSIESRQETVAVQSGAVQSNPENPTESRLVALQPRASNEEVVEKREEPRVSVALVKSDTEKTAERVSLEPKAKSEDREQAARIMERFADRDPKIGVWSYPAFLLLQYLYNTVPGFKMSKVAKDALERGLREMYPDLFQIAEEVSRKIYERKGIAAPR